jgi:hypothetical protein
MLCSCKNHAEQVVIEFIVFCWYHDSVQVNQLALISKLLPQVLVCSLTVSLMSPLVSELALIGLGTISTTSAL